MMTVAGHPSQYRTAVASLDAWNIRRLGTVSAESRDEPAHRSAPPHARQDALGHDALTVGVDAVEHPGDDLVGHEVGLQSEIEQAVMGGIVIVLLELLARIGDALDLDRQAHLAGDAL